MPAWSSSNMDEYGKLVLLSCTAIHRLHSIINLQCSEICVIMTSFKQIQKCPGYQGALILQVNSCTKGLLWDQYLSKRMVIIMVVYIFKYLNLQIP